MDCWVTLRRQSRNHEVAEVVITFQFECTYVLYINDWIFPSDKYIKQKTCSAAAQKCGKKNFSFIISNILFLKMIILAQRMCTLIYFVRELFKA